MRLIDADDLWSEIMALPHNGDMISSEEVEQEIRDAPAVDAVEVVRCKDCEHCFHLSAVHQDDISCSYFLIDYGITPDHFCSYGERRADGEDT